MSKPQSELVGLFQKFAAPLVDSPLGTNLGKDIATRTAQVLWKAMIHGQELEHRFFHEVPVDDPLLPELFELIQQCYESEMKPQVTTEELASLREWYDKGQQKAFRVGDQVRVQYGVADPDYPDLPLGGWAGTVNEVQEDECTIVLNRFTLDHMHPIYKRRSQQDGLTLDEVVMGQEELAPDMGEGLSLEEPSNIETKPLDPSKQQDRIRAALGVTTDDAVPMVNGSSLQQYFDYLKTKLDFPFAATYSHHDGKQRIVHRVSVVGMSDGFPIDDDYGVMCDVQEGGDQWEVPVLLLELGKGNRNRQTLEDYRSWFASWSDFDFTGHAEEPDSGDDEPDYEYVEPEQPARSKVGRNDPCPCGSGKKFKKCCLRKQDSKLLFE